MFSRGVNNLVENRQVQDQEWNQFIEQVVYQVVSQNPQPLAPLVVRWVIAPEDLVIWDLRDGDQYRTTIGRSIRHGRVEQCGPEMATGHHNRANRNGVN